MGLADNAIRKTYVSEIDGTHQPYKVFVPSSYRGKKPYPVVFVTHGFGGNENSGINDGVCAIAEKRGYILVSTRGRGGTFYDGVGDDDFWRVFGCVKRDVKIDEDRVYLIGCSMGGTGAWRLASRYPHVFAASMPICGWTNHKYWYSHWYTSVDDPHGVHPVRQPLVERASAICHAENLLHVPIYVMHGGRDSIVEVGESQTMYRRLKKLGHEVVYKEYLRSKHTAFARKWNRVFDWLEGKRVPDWVGGKMLRTVRPSSPKVRDPFPTAVVYRTNTIKFNRAYWVRIDGLIRTNEFATIRAEVKEPNSIAVKATNVAGLTLTLTPPLIDASKPVQIKIGSHKIEIAKPTESTSLVAELDGTDIVDWQPGLVKPKPGGLRKTPTLCGPIGEAICSKFILAYGKDPADEAEAKRFANQYNQWVLERDEDGNVIGSCYLKPAAKVTKSDIASSNLVLFGRPASNPILKKITGRLPIKIEDNAVTVGKKRHRGKAYGLRLIYPNPLNQKRYVVVSIGSLPTRVKDFEGLPWLFPDYVVFDERKPCSRTVHPYWDAYDAGVESGEIDPATFPDDSKPLLHLPDCFVNAGFFDEEWQLMV